MGLVVMRDPPKRKRPANTLNLPVVASRLRDYFVQLLCSKHCYGVSLQLPLLFK
jgi:hypothetical protein